MKLESFHCIVATANQKIAVITKTVDPRFSGA